MRGYSTSRAFGTLYGKYPKVACFILGIITSISGVILLKMLGIYDDGLTKISYFLIITGIIIIIGTLIYTIVSSVKQKQKEELLNRAILSSGINQVDSLTPYQFEDWVTRFLNLNGFNAVTTKRSRDFGADSIAYKDNKKFVISCKKYSGNLGIKCVQEIIGAMDYYEANEGWVVSTSPHFSKQACDLAKSRNIRLFTKNDLALMLEKLQQENKNKGE